MSNEGQWQQRQEGMTLRDYFAGQAMQGIIAAGSHPRIDPASPIQPLDVADLAYRVADAMLAARERKAKSDAR